MRQEPRTLNQLVQERKYWNDVHQPKDYISFLNTCMIQPYPEHCAIIPLPKVNAQLVTGLPSTMTLQPNALKQLISRIGYDVKVYEGLSNDINRLAMNYLNQKYEKQTMTKFRVVDNNQVRAILSDRYEDFDVLELLETIQPVVNDMDGQVRWYDNSDQVMHLAVTFPNTSVEVKKGDVVESGIWLSDSEVGFRSVTVGLYTYTLRCTNGLIARTNGDFFRFRHIGDGDMIRQAIKEGINAILLKSHGIIDKFKAAMNKAIKDKDTFLENICKDNQFTQSEFKELIMNMSGSNEDLDNLYGLTQAVSFAANKQSGEDAYKTQTLALTVLDKGLRN